MSKGQHLPFYSPPLLVEEKDIKEHCAIRMQQIGNKKEYVIRFEVGLLHHMHGHVVHIVLLRLVSSTSTECSEEKKKEKKKLWEWTSVFNVSCYLCVGMKL